MIKNGRWRGRMPFRQNNEVLPETLRQQGRTGEPSPAIFSEILRAFQQYGLAGHGKAAGSFTEQIRRALAAWTEETLGNARGPVLFHYRLSRKKIITVTLAYPTIRHRREYGRGSKGFVLTGEVLAIEGVRPDIFNRGAPFALSRIIGQHPIKILALPPPS